MSGYMDFLVFDREKRRENTPAQPIVHPPTTAPTLYAATMIADSAWARGDMCPITWDILNECPSVLVPACGHCLSGGIKCPPRCPICSAPVRYTSVPRHIAVIVPTDKQHTL
jgi:hypothetical protein